MRVLLLLFLLTVTPGEAQLLYQAPTVPGSIGYQLKSGYPPSNMLPQSWYSFSVSYFELSRLNAQAADEYGRMPVDRAVDLYPGMVDRVNLERRFLQQRQAQQRAFYGIQQIFRR